MIQKSEQCDELMKAIMLLRRKMLPIVAFGFNPHFKSKYVRQEDLYATITPLLNECGLVVVHAHGESPDPSKSIRLLTELHHPASGQWMASTCDVPLGSRADPQGFGGATTYARRHATMTILGAVQAGDDDDASITSGNGAKARRDTPTTDVTALGEEVKTELRVWAGVQPKDLPAAQRDLVKRLGMKGKPDEAMLNQMRDFIRKMVAGKRDFSEVMAENTNG